MHTNVNIEYLPAVLLKPYLLLIVTPDAVSVTCPVPFCTIIQLKPTAKEGTVIVVALELLMAIIFPLSESPKVKLADLSLITEEKLAIVDVDELLPVKFPVSEVCPLLSMVNLVVLLVPNAIVPLALLFIMVNVVLETPGKPK